MLAGQAVKERPRGPRGARVEGLALPWEQGRDGFLLRALYDGQVVGSARGHWQSDSCALDLVEVAEAWRRRGIGRLLVVELQRLVGSLVAYPVSAPGAALLAACGFVEPSEPNDQWSWPKELAAGGDRDF